MSGDPRGGDRQALVLTLTVVCGLAGGLLAVGLLRERFEAASVWAPLLIVCGVGVVATAVAYLLLTARPAPAHRPAPPPVPQRPHAAPRTAPPPARPWYDATANQSPPPAQRPQAAPEPRVAPGHVVLPLDSGDAGGDWWNKSAPAAAAGKSTAPAPDLPSHVADGTALVAQCPNCGDFRIDVHRADPGYAFRCRNPRCGEEWQWTPGTPWPTVVVRRNLTGRERGR
jgi:hypothetical protein